MSNRPYRFEIGFCFTRIDQIVLVGRQLVILLYQIRYVRIVICILIEASMVWLIHASGTLFSFLRSGKLNIRLESGLKFVKAECHV